MATEPTGRKTCYVTNVSPDHKYDSLSRYGAMRPITSGNYPIFKTQRLLEEIAAAVVQSKSDDYLVFSGSGFVSGLCLHAWLNLHRQCNVLLYDPKQDGYVPRILDRNEVNVQIEKARDRWFEVLADQREGRE